MGKTRRKEKIISDAPDEYVSEVGDTSQKKTKKSRKRTSYSIDDYDKDENFGSFQKIGKRK